MESKVACCGFTRLLGSFEEVLGTNQRRRRRHTSSHKERPGYCTAPAQIGCCYRRAVPGGFLLPQVVELLLQLRYPLVCVVRLMLEPLPRVGTGDARAGDRTSFSHRKSAEPEILIAVDRPQDSFSFRSNSLPIWPEWN
jgi:hypothetical protein